jgi:parallel beta-helix repeat protein
VDASAEDLAETGTVKDPFARTVINVKDHGACGNDSTDDTDALQALIEDSHAGDAIYFPPGKYLVSKRLIPKARQLYFSLTGATIKAVPETTAFAIFHVTSGPVEFHHLTLDLSETTRKPGQDPPAAILAQAGDAGIVDLVVSSCRIRHGLGQGIRVGGGESGRDRVIVRDTRVAECFESGLTLNKVNGARVEGCRFERCRNGIQAASCRDVVVHAVSATENRRHGIVFRFSHDWHVDNSFAMRNGGKEDDQPKLRGWGIAAGGGPEEGAGGENSDFTITNNICEGNYDGGTTLDPTVADDPTTEPDESAKIFAQRARISGNVCRGRKGGQSQGGGDPFGSHGIHVRNSSDVVVTDNLCHRNNNSGIQIVNSRHVLVQANACYDNTNGIGLFSREGLTNPGRHVIGVNMLYDNDEDLQQGDPQKHPRAIPGIRLYGLHGSDEPDETLRAHPGTLFEWHEGGDGALYVKQQGSGADGWVKVVTQPDE